MKKVNPQLKEILPISDKIAITNLITNAYFTKEEETGKTEYTPYFREIAQIRCFASYVLTGVEFEEQEDVYELIRSDSELLLMYSDWIALNKDYDQISIDVKDLVDYRKKLLLKQNDTVSAYVTDLLKEQLKLQKLQDTLLSQQKKINETISPDEQRSFYEKIMKVKDEDVISKIVELVHKKETPEQS